MYISHINVDVHIQTAAILEVEIKDMETQKVEIYTAHFYTYVPHIKTYVHLQVRAILEEEVEDMTTPKDAG